MTKVSKALAVLVTVIGIGAMPFAFPKKAVERAREDCPSSVASGVVDRNGAPSRSEATATADACGSAASSACRAEKKAESGVNTSPDAGKPETLPIAVSDLTVDDSNYRVHFRRIPCPETGR